MYDYVRRRTRSALLSSAAAYLALFVMAAVVLLAGCASDGAGLIPNHASPQTCIRWEHSAGALIARNC